MKTSELTGPALDWAVAKCEGAVGMNDRLAWYTPSIDWVSGGPIIEREWIDLHCVNYSLWEAECPATGGIAMQNGPTPLIAAMRCYVASQMGDEVEVPDELH